MIAAIQIRGTIDARQPVKDTLRMLGLGKKMSCILVQDKPHIKGMLTRVKDFATFGDVSDDTVEQIKKLMKGKTAHLHPPRGGFKSIKRPVNGGGDLGKRNDMDALIGRMLP